MLTFIRENIAAIREELYASWWFVRCKLTAELARTAALFGGLAHGRYSSGKRGWFFAWPAAFFLLLTRILSPRAIRSAVDEVTALGSSDPTIGTFRR